VGAKNSLADSFKVVRNGIVHCVNASSDTAPEAIDGVTHNPCSARTWLLAMGGFPRVFNASDSEATPPLWRDGCLRISGRTRGTENSGLPIPGARRATAALSLTAPVTGKTVVRS
jgi:hypothetical protein